jgi:hypothetical protein
MKPGNDFGRAGLRLSAGVWVGPCASTDAAQTRPRTSESLGRIADSAAALQNPATHRPRQHPTLHRSCCWLLATLPCLALRLLPPMAAFTESPVRTELAVRRSAP